MRKVELPFGYRHHLYLDENIIEYFIEDNGSIVLQVETDFSSVLNALQANIILNCHAKYESFMLTSANHKHKFSLTINYKFK